MASHDKPPASAPRRRIAGESAGKKVPANKAVAPRTSTKKVPTKTSKPRIDSARTKSSKTQTQTPQTKTAQKSKTQPNDKRAQTPVPREPASAPQQRPSAVARRTNPSGTNPSGRSATNTSTTDVTPRRIGRHLNRALAVAVLCLAIGLGVLMWGITDRRGISYEESRAEATKAASAGIKTIFSYDYRTLKQHHEDAKAVMTPAYAKTYAEQTEPTLNDTVPQNKTSSQAQVRAAGARPCGTECTANEVSVLVFVDIQPSEPGKKNIDVLQQRILVRMVADKDNDWKIKDVKPV